MEFQKYNIKEKKKKKTKAQELLNNNSNNHKKIYMVFALKIGSFFCKIIVGYKSEKGVIEDLKLKK